MKNDRRSCQGCQARFEEGVAIQYRVWFAQGHDGSIRLAEVQCSDPKEGGLQDIPTANRRVPPDLTRAWLELSPGEKGPRYYCAPCFNRLFAPA